MKISIYEVKNGSLVNVGNHVGDGGVPAIKQLFKNPEVKRVTVDIQGNVKRVLEFQRTVQPKNIDWK